MYNIDLTTKTWSTHPRTPVNDLPEPFDVCGEDQFDVIQRIGSSSLNGRVYEIELRVAQHGDRYGGNKLALKVFGVNGGGVGIPYCVDVGIKISN